MLLTKIRTGGKDGAVQTCNGCHGNGVKVIVRQLQPGMIQQMQTVCPDCHGKGDIIREKVSCSSLPRFNFLVSLVSLVLLKNVLFSCLLTHFRKPALTMFLTCSKFFCVGKFFDNFLVYTDKFNHVYCVLNI